MSSRDGGDSTDRIADHSPDPTVHLLKTLAESARAAKIADIERVAEFDRQRSKFRLLYDAHARIREFKVPWLPGPEKPKIAGNHFVVLGGSAPRDDPGWGQWADQYIEVGSLLQEFGLRQQFEELKSSAKKGVWADARAYSTGLLEFAFKARREELADALEWIHRHPPEEIKGKAIPRKFGTRGFAKSRVLNGSHVRRSVDDCLNSFEWMLIDSLPLMKEAFDAAMEASSAERCRHAPNSKNDPYVEPSRTKV